MSPEWGRVSQAEIDAAVAVETAARAAAVTAEITARDLAIAAHAALVSGVHDFARSCRVRNSVDISIGNASGTYLTFDTEVWDTDGIHEGVTNPGRLTCVTAGKYLISAGLMWTPNATGIRNVTIVLKRATNLAKVEFYGTASEYSFLNPNTIYDLAEGDYIELLVYQNSGGALDCQLSDAICYFAMARVG